MPHYSLIEVSFVPIIYIPFMTCFRAPIYRFTAVAIGELVKLILDLLSCKSQAEVSFLTFGMQFCSVV